MECHPTHHEQWSGSMHAYASDDPVFVAMNKRGQRETNGALGTFCIKCHAPMAVAIGTITADERDGLRPLDAARRDRARHHLLLLPQRRQRSSTITTTASSLAIDQTMRGGAKNPVGSPAHHAKYDALMDSDDEQVARCAGRATTSTTPNGVALERTLHGVEDDDLRDEQDPTHHLHVRARLPHEVDDRRRSPTSRASTCPQRASGFHEHLWPAIDEALTPWPGTDRDGRRDQARPRSGDHDRSAPTPRSPAIAQLRAASA